MKKRKDLLKIIGMIFICSIIAACSKETKAFIDNSADTPYASTRASKDNYFDIESERIRMVNSEGKEIEGVLVPWVREAPNAGVANEWIDQNFYSANTERMYTEKNGWKLVYSNTLEKDAYKYIGIYNKYTGELRFFFYILADPGNQGSSESIWGISVNKQTSLMNFNTPHPKAMDQPASSPAFISTPEGTFTNSLFNSSGIANGTWYAMEIECAYDPNITIDNSYYFTIMGRAVNKITSKGTATSEGGITGTITTTVPSSSSSSINVNISNMFNSSTTQSVNISKDQANNVGEKIDDGIKKNDSFLKGLWSNIKNNASQWISTGLENGAKKGIEAIISSGGSIAANTLKGLFNGLIGGGEKNMISKVDLKVNLKSNIEIVSEQQLMGWSDKRLSIPGSPDQSLLYNSPLGVWNLKLTPQISVETHRCLYYASKQSYPQSFAGMKYYYTYSTNVYSKNSIILNPEIEKDFRLENYKATIITESTSKTPFTVPYAYLNNEVSTNTFSKYYTLGDNGKTSILRENMNPDIYKYNDMAMLNFKVIISFDLVHKTQGFKLSYSKIFDANKNILLQSTWTTYLDDQFSQHPFWGGL